MITKGFAAGLRSSSGGDRGAYLLCEVGGEGLSDQKKLNERKQKRKGVKCDIHV